MNLKIKNFLKYSFIFFLISAQFGSDLIAYSFIKKSNKKFDKLNYLIRKEDYETARNILYEFIEKNYNIGYSFLLIGDIFFKENNFLEARKYYEKALEKVKNKKIRGIIYNNLTDTYIDKSEISYAIRILKEAIITENFNEGTYIRLANFYYILGFYDDALDNYSLAYNLNPYNEYTNFNIAVLNTMKLDYETAINFYKNILILNPLFYSAKLNLVKLYIKTGDIDIAYSLLIEMDEVFVNYDIKILLGEIYYKRTNYLKSYEFYKSSLYLAFNAHEFRDLKIKDSLIGLYSIAVKIDDKNLKKEIRNFYNKNFDMNNYLDKIDLIFNF
jgi:tetratricopeptide (TPR) repeat protein